MIDKNTIQGLENFSTVSYYEMLVQQELKNIKTIKWYIKTMKLPTKPKTLWVN